MSKFPALIVTLRSLQFKQAFVISVLSYDLVEFFYVLEPVWEIVTGFAFMTGLAWATTKALKISIGKPPLTIQERIEELEEDMYEKVEDEE